MDYDGQWVNNRPEGNGIYKLQGKEFMGRFKKGKFIEDHEYTVRLENGSLYKGKVKDLKPEGRGYLIDDKGTRKAEFKNGELIC